MVTWQFFQGLRAEWRWYRFDANGEVAAESDEAFDELKACMANAEAAGFQGEAYQVHARQSGFLNADAGAAESAPETSATTVAACDRSPT